MSSTKNISNAPSTANWVTYLTFVTCAAFCLPRIPELAEKYAYVASAVFVLVFQAYCATLMLLYERQIIPLTIAEDAAQAFASDQQNLHDDNLTTKKLNAA